MAQVVRVVRNPADPESGIKAWSNGQLESFGDTPPVSFSPRWASDPVVDLWVLPGTWAAPRGLVFTRDGARHAFGSPVPAGWGGPLVGGAAFGHYRWLVMDPTGTGRGWAITCFLQVVLIGTGAVGPSPAPTVISDDRTRDFVGDYTTRKWFALYGSGGMQSATGIVSPDWTPQSGLDRWRRICVPHGWSASHPAIYVASAAGQVGAANAAEPANRGTVLGGRGDTVRALDVISDGTGGEPLILELGEANGAFYRYTAADPPSVVVVAPDGTVTDTRTPTGGWAYSDPNRDAQVEAQVAWFSSAQWSVGGFSPATSPATERQTITTRNLTTATPVTAALADGDWRMYVRARDSAGQWSAWAYGEWEQDVDTPSTPTLGAPVVLADWRVELAVTGASGVVEVDCSDDQGVTWHRLAEVPSVSGDAVVVDEEPPFRRPRWYRARDRVGGVVSDWTAHQVVTVPEAAAWVLSAGDQRCVINEASGIPDRVVPPGLDETLPWAPIVTDPLDGGPPVVVRRRISTPRFDLTVRWFTDADWVAVETMLMSGRTLLLRSPWHHLWFEPAGDLNRSTAGAIGDELHGSTTVPVVVMARPEGR